MCLLVYVWVWGVSFDVPHVAVCCLIVLLHVPLAFVMLFGSGDVVLCFWCVFVVWVAFVVVCFYFIIFISVWYVFVCVQMFCLFVVCVFVVVFAIYSVCLRACLGVCFVCYVGVWCAAFYCVCL